MGATFSGGEKLKAALQSIVNKAQNANTVRVGFLEGALANSKSAATIAAIQEYGAPGAKIPSRPFFRNMVAKHKGEWGALLANILKTYEYDANMSLEAMGEIIQSELKESMSEIESPALSNTTLLLRERFWGNPDSITIKDVRKAFNDAKNGVTPNISGNQAKPLIWTGDLQHAINFEVNNES